MAKVKIAYRGKILKRSLLTPSIVVERMEYMDLLATVEELISYNVATVIIHGETMQIEKPVGTTLWYRLTN